MPCVAGEGTVRPGLITVHTALEEIRPGSGLDCRLLRLDVAAAVGAALLEETQPQGESCWIWCAPAMEETAKGCCPCCCCWSRSQGGGLALGLDCATGCWFCGLLKEFWAVVGCC